MTTVNAYFGDTYKYGNVVVVRLGGKLYLLTCAHTVVGAEQIVYNDQIVKLKCYDEENDLALLRLDDKLNSGNENNVDVVEVPTLQNDTARFYGDCGRFAYEYNDIYKMNELICVVTSHNSTDADVLYRFLRGFIYTGICLPAIIAPKIKGYYISAVDHVSAPAAYRYLFSKLPGESVIIAFVNKHREVVCFTHILTND